MIAGGDVKCQWCASDSKCTFKSFFGVLLAEMDGAPACSSAATSSLAIALLFVAVLTSLIGAN